MFSAVEFLSVNHSNSSDIFVLLLCKDSRCLGIHGYLFEKHTCSLGSTVWYHGKGWGWNTSTQHPIPSNTWIKAALGGAAPQKSLSHIVEGERGTHRPGKRRHIFKCKRWQESRCQAGLPPS